MLQKTSSFFSVMLVLLALCTLLYSCTYSSKASKRLYAEVENKSFDMLIVPGVPLEDSLWSRTMKGRIYWSKFLYDKGIAKNIMYSGSAVYTPYCEAEIMAMYAAAIGIPKEHIFIETKAEHSTENIYYSYKKARKLGFKTAALASDPFQTKLLSRFTFKRVDPYIAIIPFVVDTLKMLEPQMTDPTINYQQALVKDFVPLKRRESFFKRLAGTLGWNRDKTLYN